MPKSNKQESDMSSDAALTAVRDSFIAGMRQLGAATCIVTTGSKDIPASGLTATAISSVSMDPPTLLACVNMDVEANRKIRNTGHFCVNILAEDQQDLAMLFADPGRKPERFKIAETTFLKSACPAIVGAAAQIDCELEAAYPGGDSHTIFVGRVLECVATDKEPLLYQGGQFGTFKPLGA